MYTDDELAVWIEEWVARRNGFSDPRLSEAWKILADTVYDCRRCQEGTVENVMCAIPSWTANNASSWGPRTGLWYDSAKLERARQLLEDAGANAEDVADVRRQCFANNARSLIPTLQNSQVAREKFLALFDDAASAVAGIPAFSLATCENQARARAGERGAKAFRRMVTTWADPKFGITSLSDYANREYAELIRDYYLPRWKKFLGL